MNRFCPLFVGLASVVACSLSSPLTMPPLPPDTRLATDADYAQVHPLTRGEATPVVPGDFDGNGLEDVAAFVISNDGTRWGLTVFLQGSYGEWNAIELAPMRSNAHEPMTRFGMLPVAPGTYRTYCFHQPEACAPDQPKELHLTNDAFQTLRFESQSSIYYWDRITERFLGAPMSD